jgi:hypothetical protein
MTQLLSNLVIIYLLAYEDGTECFETSAYKSQTPGNYPEENIQHTEHGGGLKSRKSHMLEKPAGASLYDTMNTSKPFVTIATHPVSQNTLMKKHNPSASQHYAVVESTTSEGAHLNTIERFHIYAEFTANNHLNDNQAIFPSAIFDTLLRTPQP